MEQVSTGSIEMISSGDPRINEIEYLSLPYLMASNDHWNAVLILEAAEEGEQVANQSLEDSAAATVEEMEDSEVEFIDPDLMHLRKLRKMFETRWV
ncbi:hypothetical protein CR194_07365 [Salipaludibacillus keqinensis]|uniref:Uncharacterized protein n=1 Tax=Salipaludibacillus keqinensis TaxID=2045207 RepID=A0A323TE52_9BACI|nr:hypothetical protein [Salipaludibacillus keqinensis]PYZ93010.1 hypothetical protein CR194_07365 [Salipaludibacillus keqinensis]